MEHGYVNPFHCKCGEHFEHYGFLRKHLKENSMFNFDIDIKQWIEVSKGEVWPEGAKEYEDVPYLQYLKEKFADIPQQDIAMIFLDLFHLMCMDNVLRTYKSVSIMLQSIEKDAKIALLKELRDALDRSLGND